MLTRYSERTTTNLEQPLGHGPPRVLLGNYRRPSAMQYAAEGIRCNAILPGLMDTPMVEHALKTAELNFSREMFDTATVKASRTGIAIYSDRQELIGKPVTLGELSCRSPIQLTTKWRST